MQRVGLQLPSDASNTITYGSIGNISYQDGEVKINSIPYEQYMQTEREDVSYTTKIPVKKSPGQLAYEKALAEKAAHEQHSEEDNSVSDRELLLEAAEREGAGEELRRYAQKARNLEAYQKRLERQQKKLEEMKTESPGLADASQQAGIVARSPRVLGKGALQALEKRIEETEKLIANTQTAMTRKTKLRKRMFSELCAFLLFTSRSRRPWSRAGDGP